MKHLEEILHRGRWLMILLQPQLLQGVYASLEYTFTSYQEIFPLSDLTTDEAIAPTRGGDWDDNGILAGISSA